MRFLPDKAIDLVDEAASRVRLKAFTAPNGVRELEDKIKKLKDELDEREGMLKKYGESYDGENWRDRAEAAERERDEIRRKYRDRFLYGEDKKAEEVEDDKQTSREEIKREQKEDIRRDGKKQTFEELFEEREG